MTPALKQIHLRLRQRFKTVAVAESCTGGLISGLLTQTPGSSAYFILGIVAYHNQAKQKLLNIPERLLSKKGAVSQAVAQKMACAVRKLAKADLGIGVTGIAGPQGATPGKPVGTVFIAVESKHKKICQKFIFKGNRRSIRKKAAHKALELLKALL